MIFQHLQHHLTKLPSSTLPANVQDLLTDLGFDANIASESDIDAVLERVKKLVKVDINL